MFVDLVARAFAEIIDAKSPSPTVTPRGSRGWPWRWPNAPAWDRKAPGTSCGPPSCTTLTSSASPTAYWTSPAASPTGSTRRSSSTRSSPTTSPPAWGPSGPSPRRAANHHEKLDGSGYHRRHWGRRARPPLPHPRRRQHLRRSLRRTPLPQGHAPGESPWHPERGGRHQDRPRVRRDPRGARRQRRAVGTGFEPARLTLPRTQRKSPGVEPRACGFALMLV
jgi:hypothetical protein